MRHPDLVLRNAVIVTMDDQGPPVLRGAVAISGSRIEGVGSENEILRNVKPQTEVLDLRGGTVVPGFLDSHVHFTQTALGKLAMDLNSAHSKQEIYALLSDALTRTPEGELIYGFGLDEMMLREKDLPSRQELDVIAPYHPVWLNRVEYHISVVNSRALNLLHLPLNLSGVEKDAAGIPTGILRGKANSLARIRFLDMIPEETRKRGLHKAAAAALEVGITTLNAMEGGYLFRDVDADFLHRYSPALPVDIVLFYQTTDVEKVLAMGLKRIGGCIFLDGSFGSRNAALSSEYEDGSGDGVLFFTDEEIEEFVENAHNAGLQITVHAIGDKAIDQILRAYEKVLMRNPRVDHRHRIEHFELPSPEHIRLARELGIVVSVQPAYEDRWGGPGGMYEMRLGSERMMRTNPFREEWDAGLCLVGGSDSDVTPMNPILGIHAAVNHPNPAHRLTPKEALRMFTRNAAWSVFEEDRKGKIAAGKLADLVVLSDNPLTVPPCSIKDITVMMTIKEGTVVFSR